MATQSATMTESLEHVPASEQGGNFPPFDVNTFASQFVWLVIFFVALYLLVSRFIQPRMGGIIAARSKHIADDLAEAERNREQADAALAAYDKSLAGARDRAQTVGNETHERLKAESEKARHALEAQLGTKLADAEKKIAATKSAAMANVRTIAAETAGSIVERLIGSPPDKSSIEAAVADALKR